MQGVGVLYSHKQGGGGQRKHPEILPFLVVTQKISFFSATFPTLATF